MNLAALNPATLPPEVLEALMEQYRRELSGSLRAWCVHALAPAEQAPAAHHDRIIAELEAVARGDVRRLMIFLPPGSAKSTYASVLFPPWFLAQRKGVDVVAASHTVELAEQFGRRGRDLVSEHQAVLGAALAGDGTAAGSWRLDNRSGYYAVGVGGALTGRRADVVVLDDPVKDQQQADSEAYREHVWNWYNSVLLTRLKPGGRVVIVMTRWHQDDLAGRLLATAEAEWRVLSMPALAIEGPETDPLGREIGEPLWGDGDYGYGSELLDKRDSYEKSGAMRVWSALYQQRPTPGEGALFQVGKILVAESVPLAAQRVRAWDLAATAKASGRDPDRTAGVKLARVGEMQWVVEDVVRFCGGPQDVERVLVETAQADGHDVRISLPQDPGQAGKAQAAYLVGKLAGYPVKTSTESGKKETRASGVIAQANVGNLSILRGAWNAAFLGELRDFPAGAKDDQVDALSRAFNEMASGGFDSSYGWVR